MKISKLFSLLLCFTLLFSFSFQGKSFAKSNTNDEFTILVDNDKKLQIKLERDGVKGILKYDKETNELSLNTNEKSEKTGKNQKDYTIDVETLTEDKIEATFTDIESGEKYDVNTDEVQASFVWLVPLGVVIGEALLAHLLSIGLALVIAGVTYTLASEIASKLKNKEYYYYAAYLNSSKGVYIGNPISLTTAKTRLNESTYSSNNVWSKSSYYAKKVAVEAGGGRAAVFDGPHGTYPKYLPHFHKWNRSGGHSFYSY